MPLPVPSYAFLFAGLLTVLLYVPLGGDLTLPQLVLGIAAIGALLWRASRRERGAWIWVGVGANILISWLAFGLQATAEDPYAMQPIDSPQWLLYFAGTAVLIVTWAAAARLRGRRDLISTIDGLAVATALAVPFMLGWVEPAFDQTELSRSEVVATLITPAMFLVLIAVSVRTLLGPGRWNKPALLMMVGLVGTMVADVGFNLLVLAGDDDAQGLTDLGWSLAYACWGAAALHPAAADSLRPGSSRYGVAATRRTFVVVTAAALPLCAIAIAHIQAVPVPPLIVLGPLAVMIVLLTVRLVVLRRRGARSVRPALILSSAGIIALLVGLGLTQAQTSSDRQREAANELLKAYAETESVGFFGANAFAQSNQATPAVLMEMTARTTRVQMAIMRLEPNANGVDRARLRALHDDWLVAAQNALSAVIAGDVPRTLKINREQLTPRHTRLARALLDASERYRDGAAASAKQGRIASVLVLVASLCALCLLFLRFGGARRTALAAIARNEAIQQSELRVRALIEGSPDVITVIDADTAIIDHADTVERVLGYPEGTMHGRRLADLLAPSEGEGLRRVLQALATRPGATETLTGRVRVSDGRVIDVEASIVNHVDTPHLGGYVVNARDVSERRLLEAQLEHQALHDPLTSLPNRALLEERMRSDMRSPLQPLHALVLLDINDFKAINDTFGHSAGDTLLCQVAAQLRSAVAPGDLLARVGGDEFAVLLDAAESPEVAVALAHELAGALRAPVDLGDGQMQPVRVSVGVAVSDGAGNDPARAAEHLLRNAELAMYEAKRSPEGREVALFVDEMHAAVAKRLELRTELERAITEGELALHYQPIVDLPGHRIAGYEALVRWIHPQRGMISPGEFIPVAEESGLIVPLGSWVLREACRQAAEWHRQGGGERYVSVNVAGQQLQREDFADEVIAAVHASGLPPHLLLLEVTETGLVGDTEGNQLRLDHLRELGTRLAIDDFGTGYSSLSYLHRFPFDVLKIDKSFIDRITTEESGRTLVEAMVRMADSLNLSVVAEGIEEAAQVQALLEMDCALGQGFHFSRPLPAADVPGFALAPSASFAEPSRS